MTSSFVIGGTTVNFLLVDRDGFDETCGVGIEFRLTALLASVADFNTLLTLRTPAVDVAFPPGAALTTLPVIDVLYGAGSGTLTIDNVTGSPFTALLKELQRPSATPDGKVRASCTFLKTA